MNGFHRVGPPAEADHIIHSHSNFKFPTFLLLYQIPISFPGHKMNTKYKLRGEDGYKIEFSSISFHP